VPLPPGCSNEQYLDALDGALERIASELGSIMVVSLGFDTYGQDPIGDFALTTDVYHEVGRRCASLGKRLVILAEGGYYLPALGENARTFLRGVEGRSYDPLPALGFSELGIEA
jgi:acetoin utilization deacetylase AcuC-like enzyme